MDKLLIGRSTTRYLKPAVYALLTGLFMLILIKTAWLDEDFFITLRVVDNFWHGHGLRWNISERVQVYTHPLWMLALLGAYGVTAEFFFTTLFLSMIISLCAVLLLAAFVSAGFPQTVCALLLLIFSRTYIDFCTSGLENPLSYLLVVLFVIALFHPAKGFRRTLAISFIGALLMLNRHDFSLIVAPALALTLWQHGLKKSVLPVTIGFSPLAIWHAFALVYYGFIFPNTAYAKLGHGAARMDLIAQGMTYLAFTMSQDVITLLIIAVGVCAGLCCRSAYSRALAIGAILYVIYVIVIGGDHIAGRALSVPFFLSVCILTGLGAQQVTRTWPWIFLAITALTASLLQPAAPPCSGIDFGHHKIVFHDPDYSIFNTRALFYAYTGLLNYPPYDPLVKQRAIDYVWALDGRDFRMRPYPEPQVIGNVGMYGYYAGPEALIVDLFAITDAFLARLPAIESDVIKIAHFNRKMPYGYVASRATGINHLSDPALARLYEALDCVIRGPIWRRDRWRHMVLLNLGVYQSEIDRSRYAALQPEWAWLADTQTLLDVNNHDGAMHKLRELLQFSPDCAPAYEMMMQLHEVPEHQHTLLLAVKDMVSAHPELTTPRLYLGQILELNSQFDEARAVYQAVLDMSPEIFDAQYHLAMLDMREGNTEQGIIRLLTIINDPVLADRLSINKLDAAATMLVRLDALDAARKVYARIVDYEPDNFLYLKQLADLCYATGDIKAAAQYYQASLAKAPDSAYVADSLDSFFRETTEDAEAEAFWNTFTQANASVSLPFLYLGMTQERRGDLDAASTAYMQALALRPDCAQTLCRLGAVEIKDGRLSEGLDHVRSAIALDASLDRPISERLTELAGDYASRQQHTEAIALYTAAHEILSSSGWPLLRLGEVYQAVGDMDAALAAFHAALMASPALAEAADKFDALACKEPPDAQRCLDAWNAVITRHPDATTPLIHLARAQERFGALEDAAAIYQRVLSHEPDNGLAAFSMGAVDMQLGHFAQGLTRMQQAVERDPSLASAVSGRLVELADNLVTREEHAQASQLYQTALDISPTDLWPLVRLGELYEAAGEHASALDAYRTVLLSAPESPMTAEKYDALLRCMEQDVQLHIEAWAAIIARHPESAIPLIQLGRAHERDGALDAAREAYARVLATTPDQNVARYLMGAIEIQQGQFETGLNRMKQAAAQDNSLASAVSERLTALADDFISRDESASAMTLYQTALDISPTDLWPLARLGALHEVAGKIDAALDAYRKVLMIAPESPMTAEKFDALLIRAGKDREQRIEEWAAITATHPESDVPLRYLQRARARANE